METTRRRLGSILEWLIAAAFIVAIVAATAIAVPQVSRVQALLPVEANEAPTPEATTAVPPGAVSLPMLLLGDGQELRIGDRVSDVTARIGADAQVGDDAVERVADRDRLTRLYEYNGTRFALMFEAVDPSSEPRVVGIYKE